MSKWVIAVLFALVSASLFFSVRYGLKPKPVRQINPTVFEDPESIGAVVHRRLIPEWAKYSVVVVGSSPWLKAYEKPWSGLVKTARKEGPRPFDWIVEDQALRPVPLKAEYARATYNNLTDFPLEELKTRVARGERILIHAVAFAASHFQEQALSPWLERQLGRPVLAISQQTFAVAESEIAGLKPDCADGGEQGPPSLGCEGRRFSKAYLRKKLRADKYVAGLERHGRDDSILFIYEP